MVRLDKWLWAARFFKTRGLAQAAIESGRALVAGERVKPSRQLREGEMLTVTIGDVVREVQVIGLSENRGPAPVAQALYAETEASLRARAEAAARRRLAREPAESIVGRPTKRDRRSIERLREPPP